MTDVGIAIIGTGTVAERHARAIAALEGARLAAVYDSNADRARDFSRQHGVEYADALDSLLARDDVQLVTVATPSGTHSEVVLPVAAAGKHIICEKPLETTLEKVDRMLEACDSAGVILSAVFQARFGDNVRVIRDAISAGRFGRMILASVQVKWYRSEEYYQSAGWRGTWELDGGGALMNQSIHMIDLLLHLAGDVREVYAHTATITHPGLEVEDTASATLRFASGGLGVIEASTSCAPGFPRKLEISGESGSVVMEDDRIVRWQFADELPEDEAIRERGSSSEGLAGAAADPRAAGYEGHRRQFQDVVNAVRENRKPTVPGSEGRRAVELITAIYRSARTGEPCQI